jgi:hypothetical protein
MLIVQINARLVNDISQTPARHQQLQTLQP